MSTSRPHLRRAVAGFTLPELITALVIAGVLASAAVPRLTAYIDQVRTRRALDQVVADVAYARLIAIQQGRRTAVRFGTGGSYTVDTLSVNGSWGVLRAVNLDQEYRGVTISATASALEFTSRGLIANFSDGVIRMSRGSTADSLFVSQSGRVYRA